MSTELTKQNQTNLQALSGFLKSDRISGEIEKVLGRNSSAFVTSALTAIGSNDMLKEADKGGASLAPIDFELIELLAEVKQLRVEGARSDDCI